MRVNVISILLTILMVSSGPLYAQANTESKPELDLGPGSVPSQLKEIQEARKTQHPRWPSIPSLQQYNLSLAADYQVLAQQLNESPSERNASGGVARVFGTWRINPQSSSPGRLVFKVEHRHRFTELSPQTLLPAAGVSGVSGPTFSDKKGVLTNLYWGQSFKDNEFGYIAGIIDVADFIDVYGLVNPWTEFNNLAFATNPTIPVPSQGVGAAVRWLMPSNYYITGSIADINGNPHEPENAFDSFFNTAEYLSHVEFGRVGSWEDHWADNIHITLWQADAREEAGLDSDWGASASFSQRFGAWLPFFRAGYADKGVGIQKKTISTGSGYAIQKGHFVGIGLSWGQTASNDRNQTIVEAYYKWQAFNHILLVPGIQRINKPSYNTDKDQLWMATLKFRMTF